MISKAHTIRLGCTVAILSMLAFGNGATEDRVAQMSVKAAIVHKIARFVAWPDGRFEGQGRPLRLCVLGDQVIFDAFAALRDRPIHGRSLRVLRAPHPPLVARFCDVLYLGKDEEREAAEWLSSVAGQPVLTVGEAGQYGGDGSIVTMTVRQNKVSFAINLKASENTGLRISAQLLQVATSTSNPGV